MSTRQINDQIDMLFDKKLTAIGQVGRQKVNEMTQIKSEKAKAYIKEIKYEVVSETEGDSLLITECYLREEEALQAVVIAETEANSKAVEAFKRDCKFKTHSWCDRNSCDGCAHLVNFINELNK